ncbi:hypothetical protein [Streptomyces reniochalinae]|uniref:Uncharacterized protein n=1 Tax=Streptomyces reniochalinae TaxID=2250578 RepID=A0A367EW14_9ACTN|nr:hypothetical protein [Streptomyces reniochalinae]RCG22318.1 hypothetical protein DQ392_07520 [Streptomyces reniochalinae]
MVRKKVEGDEEQRRAAAHKAHRDEEPPSARSVTTGASKQRAHRAGPSARQDEEMLAQRQGKQGHSAEAPSPAPRGGVGPAEPRSPYQGRGRPGYSQEHEKVFRALVTAEEQHGGEAVSLEDVSREAAMPRNRTRTMMHDLVTVHHLATELQSTDTPDVDSRYESKPGR